MSLEEQSDRLREKLREAQKERHEAHPGERRERLGGVVRRIRDHLERILARIEREKRPNWSGHVPVLGATGNKVVCEANKRGLVVTSTIDGTHSSTSYHYQRRAIDFGVTAALVGTSEARTREVDFQRWLAAEYPQAREVFGPDSFYIKNGARVAGAFPNHGDHDHFAI